jgi:hypothetical protein
MILHWDHLRAFKELRLIINDQLSVKWHNYLLVITSSMEQHCNVRVNHIPETLDMSIRTHAPRRINKLYMCCVKCNVLPHNQTAFNKFIEHLFSCYLSIWIYFWGCPVTIKKTQICRKWSKWKHHFKYGNKRQAFAWKILLSMVERCRATATPRLSA